MTIEEIKAIPIAAFLARMGYEPARRRGDEYWYLAPYREERLSLIHISGRASYATFTVCGTQVRACG